MTGLVKELNNMMKFLEAPNVWMPIKNLKKRRKRDSSTGELKEHTGKRRKIAEEETPSIRNDKEVEKVCSVKRKKIGDDSTMRKKMIKKETKHKHCHHLPVHSSTQLHSRASLHQFHLGLASLINCILNKAEPPRTASWWLCWRMTVAWSCWSATRSSTWTC